MVCEAFDGAVVGGCESASVVVVMLVVGHGRGDVWCGEVTVGVRGYVGRCGDYARVVVDIRAGANQWGCASFRRGHMTRLVQTGGTAHAGVGVGLGKWGWGVYSPVCST
jgi:hypothetical protein